jgi:rRNA maturation protein Nop10
MDGAEHKKGERVTTIRASCPSCGDVELTIADVTVRVCAADNHGSYTFRCPQCRGAVVKDAEPRIVDLLVSSGVKLDVWQLPAELYEPKSGPVIGHDDLLDFHALLQSDDWYDRLLEVTRR